jgi:U3 small nucleolar RNA-associated protein 7
MVLAGHKGHVAVVDCLRKTLITEYYTRESTRDAVFLHNMSFHAVAQKKYVYIYDAKGAEIHCLKSHVQPLALDFLPYHFLLASVGNAGFLKYQVGDSCGHCLS